MECFNVPVMAKQMGLKVCQLCAVDFSVKHFLLPLIDEMQKEINDLKKQVGNK